jgi:hypothetical protein
MAKLQYLKTTVAKQYRIHEEIKSRLNSKNACYRSVQDTVSFQLLTKNPQKMKIYRLHYK